MYPMSNRILFVDDDQDMGAVMRDVLALSGYQVTPVSTLAEGLNLARSRRFDLYLLDQRFPDGCGLELCRQIRQFDRETPILFYSAFGREVDKQLAKAAGAQDYLRKPATLEVLEQTISMLLPDPSQRALEPEPAPVPKVEETAPWSNLLLSALSQEDYLRLLPKLQSVTLSAGDILYESGEPIRYAYFPSGSVVALLATMIDGSTIEVGLVGYEGMIGHRALLGDGTAPSKAVVQVSGRALKIGVEALKEEFNRGGSLQRLLLNHSQSRLNQICQSSACHGLHKLNQRLCRLLLMISDRAKSDVLPLTHEAISRLLGTRRSGVSVAAGLLQDEGLIRCGRGKIILLNREGLAASACECYRLEKESLKPKREEMRARYN